MAAALQLLRAEPGSQAAASALHSFASSAPCIVRSCTDNAQIYAALAAVQVCLSFHSLRVRVHSCVPVCLSVCACVAAALAH